MKIEIPSKADLQQRFGDLGIYVGPRTGPAPRTNDQMEFWCLRQYVFTLAAVDRLAFPVTIEKSESPDFLCKFGSHTLGIEVTQATDPRDQREMTKIEKQDEPTLRGSLGGRFPNGASGDAPEQAWQEDVIQAIKSKAQKVADWSQKSKAQKVADSSPPVQAYSLLLYANSNAESLIFDWQLAFQDFEPANERVWNEILAGLPVESVAVICGQWLLMLGPDGVHSHKIRSGTDDD